MADNKRYIKGEQEVYLGFITVYRLNPTERENLITVFGAIDATAVAFGNVPLALFATGAMVAVARGPKAREITPETLRFDPKRLMQTRQ